MKTAKNCDCETLGDVKRINNPANFFSPSEIRTADRFGEQNSLRFTTKLF